MGTVTVRWIESHLMVGIDSNGNSIVIGRSPENEQEFVGVKPSDLLLLGAASCSMYDVVDILKKQREPLQDIKIFCTGDQQVDPPYAFTSIHLHYVVYGEVNSEKLEKAIQLSEVKYCSVICTLRSGVTITSDYEIVS